MSLDPSHDGVQALLDLTNAQTLDAMNDGNSEQALGSIRQLAAAAALSQLNEIEQACRDLAIALEQGEEADTVEALLTALNESVSTQDSDSSESSIETDTPSEEASGDSALAGEEHATRLREETPSEDASDEADASSEDSDPESIVENADLNVSPEDAVDAIEGLEISESLAERLHDEPDEVSSLEEAIRESAPIVANADEESLNSAVASLNAMLQAEGLGGVDTASLNPSGAEEEQSLQAASSDDVVTEQAETSEGATNPSSTDSTTDQLTNASSEPDDSNFLAALSGALNDAGIDTQSEPETQPADEQPQGADEGSTNNSNLIDTLINCIDPQQTTPAIKEGLNQWPDAETLQDEINETIDWISDIARSIQDVFNQLDEADDEEVVTSAAIAYIDLKSRWIALNTKINYETVTSGVCVPKDAFRASSLSMLLNALEEQINQEDIDKITEFLAEPIKDNSSDVSFDSDAGAEEQIESSDIAAVEQPESSDAIEPSLNPESFPADVQPDLTEPAEPSEAESSEESANAPMVLSEADVAAMTAGGGEPTTPAQPDASATAEDTPMVLSEADVAAMMAGGGEPHAAPEPASPDAPMSLSAEDVARMMAADGAGTPDNGELSDAELAEIAGTADAEESWGSQPLILSDEKLELVQYMVTDLNGCIERMYPLIDELAEMSSRDEAAEVLQEVTNDCIKACAFFEFKTLQAVLDTLKMVADQISGTPESTIPEIILRTKAMLSLLEQTAIGFMSLMEMKWPTDTLRDRLARLLAGQQLRGELIEWHRGEPDRVLELDGVMDCFEDLPECITKGEDVWAEAGAAPVASSPSAPPSSSSSGNSDSSTKKVPSLRVGVDTIDKLLDVARQLVLSKNRLSSVARQVHLDLTSQETEELCVVTSDMDRLMDVMQVILGEVRMQEVGKLFEKFEKIVTNVANLNDHPMRFETLGGSTDVDRFIADRIADPIQQLLQFVVKERFERADERSSLGKSDEASLLLEARNEGCYTVIAVTEDGKPWEQYLNSIVLMDQEEDTPRLTSDAPLEERILDLMAENAEGTGLARLQPLLHGIGAEISVQLHDNGQTTYRITLPMVASVLRSMAVTVNEAEYSLPLESVEEIVRLEGVEVHEVAGEPCVRLRDHVFPLIDLRSQLDGFRLNTEESSQREKPTLDPANDLAVLVSSGGKSFALAVDTVVGQRDVVIESLPSWVASDAPFAGANICDDGTVALILDLNRVTDIRYRSKAASVAGI